MSTHSDFNMLRLEAPRTLLQITDGTTPMEGVIEITRPASWVRSMVRQQQQAENDLRQLVELCGNTVDRTDRRIQRIEAAYQTLADGTRYVYDRMTANEEVAEAWVRSELANAANAYQTFTQEVWQAIIAHSSEAVDKQRGQITQLVRINDAVAFLGEANVARSQHLAAFQGDVERWATDYDNRVRHLEGQLQNAQEEIKKVADRVPLPRTQTPSPLWRSPVRPTTSSLVDALQQLKAGPTAPQPAPGGPQNPLNPSPRRRRPPAIPKSPLGSPLFQTRRPRSPAAPFPPLQPLFFGGGAPPPRPPHRPLPPATPSPPDQRQTEPLLSAADLVRLVAQGVALAQRREEPRPERVNTARLKMENPDKFDGKSTTSFNQWWETVTMFLGFYPETNDRQKIAWLGTLLTDTAKAWHLNRYRDLGNANTWVNYVAAIRTEYHNEREGADAQLKLGQLKYQGSIRAYMTEFQALNNFAKATGEGLREKVDMAMPDGILDMRFNQNEEDPIDDEDFLQATYRAGIQVEKKKALRAAKEAIRGGPTPAKNEKKDTRPPDDRRRDGRKKEESWPTKSAEPREPKQKGWGHIGAALKGVPQAEIEDHKKVQDGCWRCGRTGHRTFDCYSFQTMQGTALPPAPWKVPAARTNGPAPTGKRNREDEPETVPPLKQQKVAAVEAIETDLPLWANSEEESDF